MSDYPGYHDYFIRVGYADTDRMSFVHHSRYLVYMESARTELLRSTGTSYKEWEESGLLLPLTESHINYKRAAVYDDMLRVRVRITQLTRTRMRFDYEISLEESGDLVATGHTAHLFMNKQIRAVRADEKFIGPIKEMVVES